MCDASFLAEFIGGPFDGDTCVILRAPSPGRVGLPVSSSDVDIVRSVAAPMCQAPVTIAVYELQASHTRWVYRYIESLSPGTADQTCDVREPVRSSSVRNERQGSLFVARDALCDWYVTIDDHGSWWAWNDASPRIRAEFASLQRAVAYIRASVHQPKGETAEKINKPS